MPNKKEEKQKVTVTKNGPYVVSGGLPLSKDISVSDLEGTPTRWAEGDKYPDKETYSLCRCGQSKNKPYCDGTHAKIGFDGTETANKEKYLDKADKITGPEIDLTDAPELCSLARFCHRAGGVWDLTERSDDPKSKKTAIEEACNCPSGRLVAWDKKTGKPIEPKFKPCLGLTEDVEARVSGPIWVKGGVPVEGVDGTKYETRNRVTLCRCGHSRNKPFCDGSHIQAEFNDGDKSLKN